MRTRTTIILLLVTALVAGILMRGDRYVVSTKDRESARANPLPFESEKIDGIEIETAEGTVSLKVVDHLWRIQKPFDDMADPDRVTALLESLQKAEWLEHLILDFVRDHSRINILPFDVEEICAPFLTFFNVVPELLHDFNLSADVFIVLVG